MKNILIILGILISFSSCAQKNKLKNFELISYEIKQQLYIYLNKYIGIEKAKIDINVESISNNSTNNKKRVV
jgi:hypothetical protein